MSTIKVTNVQNPSAASAAIVLDTNGQATLNGLAYPTSGSLSGRNRVINGDMRIDARNAGASVTVTDNAYTLDRWSHRMSGSGVYTAQRDTTVPTGQGFTNSLKLTVTTADASIATTDVYSCLHKIEGFNTADLGWGASGAASATLSFWVRSSQTGTYSVAFLNADANRGYAANYSISAANTWEYKTITVSGDTTGTWGSGNGIGVQVSFCLGCGTDRTEPAGAWTAANVQGSDSTFNWMATNGATFYITGVQLEAGTVATPFERRSFGQELALCQRYYETGTVPSSGVSAQYSPNAAPGSAAGFSCTAIPFAVTKRATPSVPAVSDTNVWVVAGNAAVSANSSHTFTASNISANAVRFVSNRIAGGTAPTTASMYMWEGNFTWTASAEL